MSLKKQTARYATFTDFLGAWQRGDVRRDRLELICWSSDASVTIEELGDDILATDDGPEGYDPGELVDRAPSTLLLKCDAADLLALQVIEALGGKGHIA